MSDQESGGGGEAVEKVKANLGSMGLNDKVVLFGSAAVVLFSFFSWFEATAMGMNVAVSGWQEYHVVGLLALIAGAVVTVMGMDKPEWLQLVLVGGGWVLAPFAFWMRVDVEPTGNKVIAEQLLKNMDMGFTFWFWLAMLAGLAATVMAALNFKERMGK